jgi:predicted nucleic acid-binding protein
LILLDTNVVSAMMSPAFNPSISLFTKSYPISDLYLPSIALAEIRYGIARLPTGRRKLEIHQDFEDFLQIGFSTRIINFNAECASSYAIARTTRQKIGRPVSVEDALIGGMALAYGATLATRNTDDFTGYGLTLVNPWQR